jgi:hypothetical protein
MALLYFGMDPGKTEADRLEQFDKRTATRRKRFRSKRRSDRSCAHIDARAVAGLWRRLPRLRL